MSAEREGERDEGWVDEICLVFMPGDGMLAVCEAFDSINRPLVLVISSLVAAQRLPLASATAGRLTGSIPSVLCTHFMCLYRH